MIEFRNIEVVFKDQKILTDINLKLKNNQTLIIKGPSGSGKSTLLNLLSLHAMPTNGKIFVDNEDITIYSDKNASKYRAKKIGYATQSFDLLEDLSVRENLLFLSCEDRIVRALKRVEMVEYIDRRVSTLSGGQKQKIAIARAILNEPKILIFDEPTANLDSISSKKFLDLIVALNSTTIIATHDKIFDNIDNFRYIYLDRGKIVV